MFDAKNAKWNLLATCEHKITNPVHCCQSIAWSKAKYYDTWSKVIYLPTFGMIFSCNSCAQVDFELASTVSIDIRDFLGNPWGQTSAGRSNNLLIMDLHLGGGVHTGGSCDFTAVMW